MNGESAMNEKLNAEIAEWLGELAPDEVVAALLGYSVGRLLVREGSHWRHRAETLRLEIGHVCDWLTNAVAERAAWLERTDEQGRPRKLMKFGDFRQMTAEADKAMRLAIQKAGAAVVDPDHERVHMPLSEGYSIVEMLSEQALDRESSLMQHCIGNGGYDSDIVRGTHLLLSLRDPHGKPHATLRVSREARAVVELQGKQNQPPAPKYRSLLREFVQAAGLRFANGGENRLGAVEDVYGEWHPLDNLPDDLETRGDLRMGNAQPVRMPSRLVVNGDFVAPDWLERHPDILHVSGSYMISRLPPIVGEFRVGYLTVTEQNCDFVLPERMEVGTLTVSLEQSRKLPRNFEVTGDLNLTVRDWRQAPAELKVGGDLDLCQSTVRVWKGDIDCKSLNVDLPQDLTVSGNIRIRGDLLVRGDNDVTFERPLRVSGNADFSRHGRGGTVKALPPRLYVAGDLDLNRCVVGKMPNHLEVGGDLVLSDAKFDNISGLRRVGGALRIEGTDIVELPERLTRVGALMGAMSKLERLADGFVTGENLILIGTPMEVLPPGLKVGGNLFVQNSGIDALPDDAVVKGRIMGISGLRDVIDRSKGGRPQVRSLRR